MLDHVFLSVSDIKRSIAFYETVLPTLGITVRFDYDGRDGPPGHPDLKGFGSNGRMFFWLREGTVDGRAAHIGFVASSRAEVDSAYVAAMAQGALIMGLQGQDFITTRGITPLTFSILMDIAWNSFSKAGNTLERAAIGAVLVQVKVAN